ncbi:WhiB family transcriptional regulator [Mycobacteroides abscessus subsp. massiliense]|uniref:WhiB family transcriptional regulator n=1 Tax=Mycobacteroides abscessus TaxID=36809 RepID=UPI0009A87C10|nr:WhiB family transcriptional regulator [Mycobacteroides abscessus subsp. massiliense]SKY71829.1 WhiB family transcriptional regulator [Mycobacteroides abscessus subsp. massiliense]
MRDNLRPGPRIISGAADIWAINHEPWTKDALCPQVDAEVFFPVVGGPGRTMAKAAKAVCAQCPVSAECLEYAFRVNEEYGVYGGLTAHERMVMKRGRAS